MSSPENYRNLLEAVNGLRSRGYTYDFSYENACLFCNKISERFEAKDLKITEYYRYEGMSDPEDNSVIYAIESRDGHKGIMIDAYGAYSDEHKTAFISNIEVVEN
ncbi:MAG: phosphoribosylpyrophosphate synthetase [Daejeonella sp.]